MNEHASRANDSSQETAAPPSWAKTRQSASAGKNGPLKTHVEHVPGYRRPAAPPVIPLQRVDDVLRPGVRLLAPDAASGSFGDRPVLESIIGPMIGRASRT
jgi:hypothetical protein